MDNEREDFDEPEEGDLVTEDHRRFFEVGFQHKGPRVVVPEDDDWRPHVRAYMDRQKFWPNVWWISDHGNAHLLTLAD
jgi:hypothetical protein